MSIARALLVLAVPLAGCAGENPRTAAGDAVDPATRLALGAPLLVDPGLDSSSRRFAVLSDPVAPEGSLPPDDFAAVTVAAARAEARQLGGPVDSGTLESVPCPNCTKPTLAQRVVALGADCAGKLVADLAQGAQMPEALPIYPRAHLREAGAARGACEIQAASFTAPAREAEVLRFYRSRAAKSGFELKAAHSEAMSALLGTRDSDGARFAVIARRAPGQISQIDLIVSGF